MIKKFINRLLGRSDAQAPQATTLGQRVELGPQAHGIDPELLDEYSVRVVKTLKEAGFEAYIVGGAVRDLLVSRRPKDFDVATNATPEQVKGLFRRAFIIGRRFRIVHVVFGRGRDHEVIEVSTFRALLGAEEAETVSGNEKTSKAALAGKTHVVDASGRVLRDNVWGPQIEDAARRDFTVNAMYYDPISRVVVDYHRGFEDVRRGTLRMIGDPLTRYREDPVRLLRVVRFAAKLGFSIEPKTLKPIQACVPLLANVPGSRLFDEMIKLLQTGHAQASVAQLQQHAMVQGVFPVLEAALVGAAQNPVRSQFIDAAFRDTDTRVAEGRSVAPSFLMACLLWHDVQARWLLLIEAGEHNAPALAQAIDEVFDARIGDISGRGKLAVDMREIWQMQPRFERRTVASATSLVEQPRFRAGYDFLRLRAEVGEVSMDLAEWWEDFHLGAPEDRQAMLDELKATQARRVPGAKKPGKVHTLRKPAEGADEVSAASSTDGTEAPAAGEETGGEAAPAKRRRRRRGPRNRAGGTADGSGPGESSGNANP